VRTFQQAYENVDFTAIQRAANDRTYSTNALGSIASCLRFSALSPIVRNLSSQFITRIVNGCRTNLIFLLDRGDRIECLFICVQNRESLSSKDVRSAVEFLRYFQFEC